MLRDRSKKSIAWNIVIDCIFLFFLIAIMVPIAFMFSASIMKPSQIYSMPYPWITKEPFFKNYFNAVTNYGRDLTQFVTALK